MNGEQCRAARALLGITQPELAQIAGVGENQLRQFEGGKHVPQRGGLQRLRAALVVRGIEFTSDAEGFGVRKNVSSDSGGRLGHPLDASTPAIRPKLEIEISGTGKSPPSVGRPAAF
jgi:transcriptional regulator with XRE-family HTH domain